MKHVKPSEVTRAQARRSALIVGGVLLAIAAWSFYRGRVIFAATIGSAGIALIILALLSVSFAPRFHILWMMLAKALGYINSRIILTLVFCLLFVPYNLLARLIGRDALNRRRWRTKRPATYWIPRKVTGQSREQFERLF